MSNTRLALEKFGPGGRVTPRMHVNRFTDYAVRVLMMAAVRAPALVTVGEVSERFGISRHHLTRVVHRLGRAGYLTTVRGVGGGFTLGRPADRISLGEVVRRCEADESVIRCVDRPGRPCCLLPGCRLKRALDEAASKFFETLDRYTLADLVDKGLRDRLGSRSETSQGGGARLLRVVRARSRGGAGPGKPVSEPRQAGKPRAV